MLMVGEQSEDCSFLYLTTISLIDLPMPQKTQRVTLVLARSGNLWLPIPSAVIAQHGPTSD